MALERGEKSIDSFIHHETATAPSAVSACASRLTGLQEPPSTIHASRLHAFTRLIPQAFAFDFLFPWLAANFAIGGSGGADSRFGSALEGVAGTTDLQSGFDLRGVRFREFEAEPLPAQFLGDDEGGAAAAEGIEDEFAGIASRT